MRRARLRPLDPRRGDLQVQGAVGRAAGAAALGVCAASGRDGAGSKPEEPEVQGRRRDLEKVPALAGQHTWAAHRAVDSMTTILGISAFYHDSAACLVVDGDIVAAAQEER